MTATTIKKFEPRMFGSSDQKSESLSPSVAGPSYSQIIKSEQDGDLLFSFGVSSPTHPEHKVLPMSRYREPVLLPRYLHTPTHEQAMCYFVHAFNSIPDASNSLKSYGFLAEMLSQHPDSRCLQVSLTAAALAAFSTRRSCRSLRLQAQAYYVSALKSVNQAIQTTPGAQGNDTMGSVLALAFYESLTSSDLTGYYHHLQGAATIAKFRGRSMAEDPIGLEFIRLMGFELSKNAMMHTSGVYNHSDGIWENWLSRPWFNKDPGKERRGTIPIRSRDIKEEARKQAEAATQAAKHGKSPGSNVRGDDVMARYLREARSILGDIALFNASAANKVKLFVDRSQQLLAAYSAAQYEPDPKTHGVAIYRRKAPTHDLHGNLIDPLTYKPPKDGVFDPLPLFGHIYIFENPTFAMQMVAAATASLAVSHLLSRCTARIHPNGQHLESEEYRTATLAAQRALEHLAGSSPWIIGWRPPHEAQVKEYMERRSRSLSPDTQDSWEEREEGSISLMLFYLWPLFSAASSEFASPTQRQYLVSVLRFMSRERGMKQADALLKVADGDFDEESMLKLVTGASDASSVVTGLMF
ncbi:negative acting factor [Zalerion maritima]|uniref:Negative acting factor n=1 Tax=Zalerion maritima TaxID=339359 RepID=A0AAD5RMY7_9PEZI|nr:negative acting factor [Zalerion maritima]